MGGRGRKPSAFPAFYKTSISLEEDRKPSAPEPFYSASNFLALRLAMSALTYEMLLVAFAAFLTFPIVLLFFGTAMPSLCRGGDMGRAGAWPSNQGDFTL